MKDLHFRTCEIQDLEELRELSCATFRDAYDSMIKPDVMSAYLEEAFNREQLIDDLSNMNTTFYFFYVEGVLAAYSKTNQFEAQTDLFDLESLEVERIYVKNRFQGAGLGRFMIDQLVVAANEAGKKSMWLGVWKKNPRAVKFYERNGFVVFGEHSFYMGDEVKFDYVMRKDLCS